VNANLRHLVASINVLPHAIKELAALGLLPALDEAGIRTRELVYTNRLGQVVWRELRGADGRRPAHAILAPARKFRRRFRRDAA